MGSAEQPADGDAASVRHATEKAAADEDLWRTVLDLKDAASKLDKHQFQEKAKLLENVDNKAMFVEAKVPSRHIVSQLRCFMPAVRDSRDRGALVVRGRLSLQVMHSKSRSATKCR